MLYPFSLKHTSSVITAFARNGARLNDSLEVLTYATVKSSIYSVSKFFPDVTLLDNGVASSQWPREGKSQMVFICGSIILNHTQRKPTGL